jgi:hypothetical protein
MVCTHVSRSDTRSPVAEVIMRGKQRRGLRPSGGVQSLLVVVGHPTCQRSKGSVMIRRTKQLPKPHEPVKSQGY